MQEEREGSSCSPAAPGNLVPRWIWYGESEMAVFASMGGAESTSNGRINVRINTY